MRSATVVLMAIVTACLIVSQEASASPKYDSFDGVLNPGGGVTGGGTGWNNGEWICYDQADPARPWYNQWFYNDPLDLERYKEIYWDIWFQPVGQPGDIVEIALNWSNDLYPDGTGRPPMPDQEEFIKRHTLFEGPVNGVTEVRLPGGLGFDNPFIISEYNPEWISIDIRFLDAVSPEGVFISGEIAHECVPEPTTLTFLALSGLAVLRRRRK